MFIEGGYYQGGEITTQDDKLMYEHIVSRSIRTSYTHVSSATQHDMTHVRARYTCSDPVNDTLSKSLMNFGSCAR